jgi:hypothetical protein
MRLVELYTSESCSSCPPADAWVSALQSHTDLWKSFVPVVFHVDYWNDLGWKDAFSSETMTRRQRELSNRWSQPAVYTPSFIIDGAEWKSWRSESAIATKFEAAQATRLTVENQSIEVSIFKRANGSIQVNLSGLLSNRHYVLRVAQLGFSISTDVKSGENSGKLLKHDFVVLNWLSEQISTQGSPGTSVGASPGAHKIDVIERTFQFATPARTTKRMAVAAWVESENNPTPLQAAGGHL